MKECLPFLLFFFTSAFAQNQILNLNGITDLDQNVHLFYEKSIEDANVSDPQNYILRELRHLNLINQSDTIIYKDVVWLNHLWNNTVLKDYYISFEPSLEYKILTFDDGGGSCLCSYIVDCNGASGSFLVDTSYSYSYDSINYNNTVYTSFDYLSMDPTDSQKIYSSFRSVYSCEFFISGFVESTDGGNTWKGTKVGEYNKIYLEDYRNFYMVSKHAYLDSTFFGSDSIGQILLSTDYGDTSTPVSNDFYCDPTDIEFYYDSDGINVYAFYSYEGEYFLIKSADMGNVGSWQLIKRSADKFSITLNKSGPGELYMSENTVLLKSQDYGINFAEEASFDNNISGLYVNPVDNSIYISTTNKIYHFINGKKELVRNIDALNSLSYYPLNTGNYFEYANYFSELPFYYDSSFTSVTILGDTLLENGRTYKIKLQRDILKDNITSKGFERIDTFDGSVYRYSKLDKFENNEYKIDSILAVVGDTIKCSRTGAGDSNYFQTIVQDVRIDSVFGEVAEVKRFWDQSYIPGYSYELAEGFGFYSSYNCEFSCSSSRLVYAIIDGVEYGKKIIVSVDEEKEVPNSFHLSQNYPNPFNPTTRMSYKVKSSKVESHVSLKIYNALGQEVATIVNQQQKPGTYEVEFDASNMSSGVYYYRLTTDNYQSTRKMILLK